LVHSDCPAGQPESWASGGDVDVSAQEIIGHSPVVQLKVPHIVQACSPTGQPVSAVVESVAVASAPVENAVPLHAVTERRIEPTDSESQ
jgi:hypothetical protein